jgi:hypothetical protein
MNKVYEMALALSIWALTHQPFVTSGPDVERETG